MLVLNGLGSADGSVSQTDYSAHGLIPATVYYAGDIWTSTPFAGDNTTVVPTDAEIEAAAALCTSGYALLDIECWDKADETGAARAAMLHQKFKAALPADVQLGSYDWGGLWGYAALARCTSPYGVGSSVYEDYFQAGNDLSAALAEHVDFLAPSFYFAKQNPLVATPNDFKVTAQCFASERARLGLTGKPIIPWVWWGSFGPACGQAIITDITRANPGVVTATGDFVSNFPSGVEIFIWLVVGMTQVNRRRFVLEQLTDTTWELRDPDTLAPIDTTGYSAYASGGQINRVARIDEWVALLAACEQYLDGCTLWLYSQQAPPHFDPTNMRHFDILSSFARGRNKAGARSAAAARAAAQEREVRS